MTEQTVTTGICIPKNPVNTLQETSCTKSSIAQFKGELVIKIPRDLYIPPRALQIMLETFEGPLDLLLYLIKKNNMDILDIRVAIITDQYMSYIQLMKADQFELAAEYLVMAATLAEIKSRVLLPLPPKDDEDQDIDPRMELIRRLQEYERFKKAAQHIDELPRMEKDTFQITAHASEQSNSELLPPTVDLQELLSVMAQLLQKDAHQQSHHIQEEVLSVREKMTYILSQIHNDKFTPFITLINPKDGRMGIIVTFIAIMELIKDSLVEIVQGGAFQPFHIKSKSYLEKPKIVLTD